MIEYLQWYVWWVSDVKNSFYGTDQVPNIIYLHWCQCDLYVLTQSVTDDKGMFNVDKCWPEGINKCVHFTPIVELELQIVMQMCAIHVPLFIQLKSRCVSVVVANVNTWNNIYPHPSRASLMFNIIWGPAVPGLIRSGRGYVYTEWGWMTPEQNVRLCCRQYIQMYFIWKTKQNKTKDNPHWLAQIIHAPHDFTI